MTVMSDEVMPRSLSSAWNDANRSEERTVRNEERLLYRRGEKEYCVYEGGKRDLEREPTSIIGDEFLELTESCSE